MQVCSREGLGSLQLLQVAVLWVLLNDSVLGDQGCTW